MGTDVKYASNSVLWASFSLAEHCAWLFPMSSSPSEEILVAPKWHRGFLLIGSEQSSVNLSENSHLSEKSVHWKCLWRNEETNCKTRS